MKHLLLIAILAILGCMSIDASHTQLTPQQTRKKLNYHSIFNSPSWQPYVDAWTIMYMYRQQIHQRRYLLPWHRDTHVQTESSNQQELSFIPVPLRRCQSMVELANIQDSDPRMPGGEFKNYPPRRPSEENLVTPDPITIQGYEMQKQSLSPEFLAVMDSQHKLAQIVKAKGYPECMYPIHHDVIEPVQQALEAIEASKMLEEHYPA